MRVVVLGPGASGKSTFGRLLAAATRAEWIEIDKVFWQPGLTPLKVPEWEALQEDIFRGDGWIADGDLGPYDAVEARLRYADAVVLLDVPLWRCIWRSLRRSPERLDYWTWLVTWRRKWRPRLLDAIAGHPEAKMLVVRTVADQRRALNRLSSSE